MLPVCCSVVSVREERGKSGVAKWIWNGMLFYLNRTKSSPKRSIDQSTDYRSITIVTNQNHHRRHHHQSCHHPSTVRVARTSTYTGIVFVLGQHIDAYRTVPYTNSRDAVTASHLSIEILHWDTSYTHPHWWQIFFSPTNTSVLVKISYGTIRYLCIVRLFRITKSTIFDRLPVPYNRCTNTLRVLVLVLVLVCIT